MSVRIRLRRERDRLQQHASRGDRIDGIASRIGDPHIAVRGRQSHAAPGLRSAAAGLKKLPVAARRAELKNHLKGGITRAADRDTVQEAIRSLGQKPVRGNSPIGACGVLEDRGHLAGGRHSAHVVPCAVAIPVEIAIRCQLAKARHSEPAAAL